MKHNFEYYCKDYENIENYHKAKADDFVGWVCHHRKGIDIPTEELQALGMYYNRPAAELIFLTRSEHEVLHKKGKKRSEETRRKMSEAMKNISEETRRKMSEAKKGNKYSLGKKRSDEAKKKIGAAKKGKKHSAEHNKKIGAASIGKHWYNNGKETRFCFECPDGFIPGRIKKP